MLAEVKALPLRSNADVIAYLQKTLDRAKAGDVVAIVATVQTGDGYYEFNKKNLDSMTTLGLLSRAAHHIQTALDIDG